MNEKLTVTKDRVLKAAADCPTAKRTLETLFPEAFKNGFDLSKLCPKGEFPFVFTEDQANSAGLERGSIQVTKFAGPEEYRGKAFFLSGSGLIWRLEGTNSGSDYILIPKRKD